MKIDGKALAESIQSDLKKQIILLNEKDINPHLLIILVGDDPSSLSYINQKIKQGESIGIKISLKQFPVSTSEETLLQFVEEKNSDESVHGIIIQRPLPIPIDKEKLDSAVIPEKDVDGFNPQSAFEPPLALAVNVILKDVHRKQDESSPYHEWLKSKNIVFIGRGEAGGGPVIAQFVKMGIPHTIIHSRTENPEDEIKNADIIVSSVGKENVVKAEEIKKDVILIGIGLHKKPDNKLYSDYNEELIQDIASYYTPTPGGVGPLNVTMLLSNVTHAATKSKSDY